MSQLLALHGFTGAPESFAELADKSRSLELLCPALCGHGAEPDRSAQSFDEELERLAAWTRARAHGPLPVLGYSLGARIALGLCFAYPELFTKAVLVGVNPGLGDEAERAARLRWEASLIELLETNGLSAFLAEWERLPLFASQANLPETARGAQRRVRSSHDASGLAHALRALGTGRMPNYFPKLGELKLPVLLVVGENDAKFAAIAEQAAAKLPSASVVFVQNAGHNPLLEAPSALLHAVEDFLRTPLDATSTERNLS